jgi:O-antigen/teichoic acid export membrane protein
VGDDTRYRKVFWFNLAMTAGIVLAGVLCVALFGGWILRAFGKDFVAGHAVLLVLALSAIPEALALAAYQVIQSQGKMWLSFGAVVLPRDCTYLAAAYLLIPVSGASGMATAYALSQVVALASIVALVCRIGLHCTSYESSPRGDNG